VPVIALPFRTEPTPAPTPSCSLSDRTAETMQRLRNPFQTQPDRDNDDHAPGTAR
jgi:hypothetical protein